MAKKRSSVGPVAAIVVILSILFFQTSFANSSNSAQNTPYNQTSYVAINASAELNGSASAGFDFTANYFRTGSVANCSLVQISRCDNNAPSQFVCINSAYYNTYASQRQKVIKSGVCPDYVLPGTVACGIIGGYCVVTDTHGTANVSSNQSTTTSVYKITIPKITVPVNVTLPPITINTSATGSINNVTVSAATNVLASVASFFGQIVSFFAHLFASVNISTK